jgi:hypothetical protein
VEPAQRDAPLQARDIRQPAERRSLDIGRSRVPICTQHHSAFCTAIESALRRSFSIRYAARADWRSAGRTVVFLNKPVDV